ncbi:MAG: homogentisate 1,2-dioxygenase, partial [Salinivirgaceae bacterium]
MPHYHRLGTIPQKRHTIFKKPDGGLYAEQLVSTEGFSDIYSLTYHCNPPTEVLAIDESYSIAPEIAEAHNMQHRSYKGFKVKPEADYLKSRIPVLVNNDVCLHLAAPSKSMENYFFKNSEADEIIFVHEGSGVLKTPYGQNYFKYGDHIVIPRGTIYQLEFKDENNRLFIIESFSPIRYPKRYVNEMGQLQEHSP